VLPILGDVHLNELRPEHIRAMQAKLIKRKLSPRTINAAHVVLGTALEVAVKDRIIPYNPARSVEKLRVRTKKQVTPLSTSEAAAILWAVEGHRLEALYHLAFWGFRISELLGMRISDLDMTAGTVRVEQTAVTAIKGRMALDTPKSDSGYRTLPLTPRLVAVLKQRLEMLLVERGRAGWQEHGLLFPSEAGTILSYHNVSRHLKDTALPTAGIERSFTWHDFRHTAVSWLSDLGVSEEIIRAIVGHAGRSVTDRYRHIGADAIRAALETMELARLGGAFDPTAEQAKDRAWRLQSAGVKRRSEG
jgi:integrase